ATLISTFAFTMMGFLAAMITIMISVANTTTYREFKRHQYTTVFYWLYFYTIIMLVVTFIAAFLPFAKDASHWTLKSLMALTLNNIIQIIAVTVTLVNLLRRAHDRA